MRFIKKLLLARRRRVMSRAVWANAYAHAFPRHLDGNQTNLIYASIRAEEIADLAVEALELHWHYLDAEADHVAHEARA